MVNKRGKDDATQKQPQNPNTEARNFTLQFLYQCETEKLFYYSEGHLKTFVSNFAIAAPVMRIVQQMAKGTLNNLDKIDQVLVDASKNWDVSRMLSTDRIALRLAVYELLETETPTKVIINEAIELAKQYGSDQSGSFVNGLLDSIAKTLRKKG